MITKKMQLSQTDKMGIQFLVAAIILGGALRLYPVIMTGFPINDGALFYSMTRALQENHYRIPEFVQFNGLDMPFTYPPFGFYMTGLTSDLLNIDLIHVFQFLPAIVLILTIPAFFLLANTLLESTLKAGISTIFYAFLPKSITWYIMGGGITRSFGQLFLILTLFSLYKLFSTKKTGYILPSALFSTLVCLSHPEAAIDAAGIAALFLVMKVRNTKGLFHAGAVALITASIVLVWLIPRVNTVGFQPYLSAMQTGHPGFAQLAILMLPPETKEADVTIIAVLGLLGLVTKLAKKEFLLPALYFLPILIEARNAQNVITIPLTMLAGIAICELILPQLAKWSNTQGDHPEPMSTPLERYFFMYLQFYLILTMIAYGISLTSLRVSPENLDAFSWVEQNTPENSKFLIITGNKFTFDNATLEWFPLLANRRNETTIQGYEWLEGEQFIEHTVNLEKIQLCDLNETPLACIEETTLELNINYDYIYIAQQTSPENFYTLIQGERLINELKHADDRYAIEYRTNRVAIFAKTTP